MTVGTAIKELRKIPNKKMPLYFDCDHCGRGLRIREIKTVAVVATVEEPQNGATSAGREVTRDEPAQT